MNCTSCIKRQFNSWSDSEKSWQSQFMTTAVVNSSMEKYMKENKLVELSKQFAVDIVNLCTEIKENR